MLDGQLSDRVIEQFETRQGLNLSMSKYLLIRDSQNPPLFTPRPTLISSKVFICRGKNA